MHWQTSRFRIDLARPRVMGIVNVTPDSFSDGGRYASTRAALAHCEQLLRRGRRHPGHRRRVEPARHRRRCRWTRSWRACCRCCARPCTLGVPVSVDTYKPEVMRAGAGPRRRHRQRHLGAAAARRARGGRGASALRRLPDAHARRAADHAALAHGGRRGAAGARVPARAHARRCAARGVARRPHRLGPGHRLRQDGGAEFRAAGAPARAAGATAIRCWRAGRASPRWARSPACR